MDTSVITDLDYFDYGIDQTKDTAFGLFDIDHNRFVYVHSDYATVKCLLEISQGLFIVDLTQISNYKKGMLDNSVCCNWGLGSLENLLQSQQDCFEPTDVLYPNIKYSAKPAQSHTLVDYQQAPVCVENTRQKLLYIATILSYFPELEKHYQLVQFEWALSKSLLPKKLFEIEQQLYSRRDQQLLELFDNIKQELRKFFLDNSSPELFKTATLECVAKALYKVNFTSVNHSIYWRFPIHEFS